MKIITYSDLHLEFGTNFKPPKDSDADLMILAGDIITFRNFEPLNDFLSGWKKPALFVAGNHEYYTRRPMKECEDEFQNFISTNHSNVIWLNNSDFVLDDVHFFGGTMWTDFDGSNQNAMRNAWSAMNDFRQILSASGQFLLPSDTVKMHDIFKEKLIAWLEKNHDKKRVVISHHAPVTNPNTKHGNSNLQPAFNSLDMVEIIEKYQPDLWVYGHTHECDDQMIGKTRIVSNQLGYPNNYDGFECEGFNESGCKIEL
jgi:predicted phosphodiesterase